MRVGDNEINTVFTNNEEEFILDSYLDVPYQAEDKAYLYGDLEDLEYERMRDEELLDQQNTY